ncbi:hypothetical protein [Bifidobacterium callitrichidarum]|uniref:Uncharacterized protein n=1 Tax=Bifidobacterium callitrichidarum TaxID=2052941 RepID=A0A2U2N7E9_9BIFI|nr:hypothetical protein [Bifidobacterium callitrichidarum]PWG65022.1 hypothetical protein DF196_07715 [Bifidobacterium callitrichidarum]
MTLYEKILFLPAEIMLLVSSLSWRTWPIAVGAVAVIAVTVFCRTVRSDGSPVRGPERGEAGR